LDVPNDGSSETYLSDRDVRRLAWGIRALRKIQLTPPLSLHTGPEVYPATDDLVDYVRQNHLTNSHWCKSTPLGSAMVDARLRVAPSLRIVDAGVLPMVPNGNIHSTVCVVARRAATLILDDRQQDET
jgi:choline dehydrogenase